MGVDYEVIHERCGFNQGSRRSIRRLIHPADEGPIWFEIGKIKILST